VQDALRLIANKAAVNILFDSGEPAIQRHLTFQMFNIALEDALRVLLENNALAVDWRDDIALIVRTDLKPRPRRQGLSALPASIADAEIKGARLNGVTVEEALGAIATTGGFSLVIESSSPALDAKLFIKARSGKAGAFIRAALARHPLTVEHIARENLLFVVDAPGAAAVP
jgi:hypothetical protein